MRYNQSGLRPRLERLRHSNSVQVGSSRSGQSSRSAAQRGGLSRRAKKHLVVRQRRMWYIIVVDKSNITKISQILLEIYLNLNVFIKDSSSQSALNLINVAGIFYILIVGLMLSVLVATLELMYKAKLQSENTKVNSLISFLSLF